MIRIRDVTFNENSHYQLHEINIAQLIREPFLKNDTLKILQSDFIKFIEIKSDSDEKLFELILTKILIVYSSNDEEPKKTISKNDKEYLLLSISSLLKEENSL